MLNRTPKITAVFAGLALATSVLAGCSATDGTPAAKEPTMASTQAPAVTATVPVDKGPSSSASGTVETDEAGVPVTYTVAEGDSTWGIENRFGITGLAERYNRYLQPGEQLSLAPAD